MGQEIEQIKTGMGGVGHELSAEERRTLTALQGNAEKSSSIVAHLLEVIEQRGDKISSSDLPGLLRAASDAQSKAIEGITKLTGRDQAPRQDSLAQALDSLASQGLLRMSVELGPTGSDG
jgi:hypothetical protein